MSADEGGLRMDPYRDEVYWPLEKIKKADEAAKSADPRWEGRKIVSWSM